MVHVQGMAGASPVIDANKGWDEVMAKYPEIKTVAVADAGFTTEGGMKVMEDFLQRFPKGQIDAVRTDYSAMTMGALQAIKNAGRTRAARLRDGRRRPLPGHPGSRRRGHRPGDPDSAVFRRARSQERP